MEKFNIIIISLLLTISVSSYAQNYKFGKVSKEELTEAAYALDATAKAVVLYENKKVHYVFNNAENSFELVTEVFKRIKLYKKEGFNYGTERISLYKRNSKAEEVIGLKGVTYALVNGKIVETKLKKDGIFKSELYENYDEVKFTMPSLEEGAVIEYKYKITSPYVFNVDRIHLQYEIPIKKLEVTFESPEYYNFKKFTTGYLPISLKESIKNDKIVFRDKYRTGGTANTKTSFTTSEIDYRTNVYTITSSAVPAFKKEPFSGNPSNYTSSVVFELSFTKYPNSAIKNYATTWEDVAKTIYDTPSFGKELKKSNYYTEDLNALLVGMSDPLTKTKKIFEHVKNKMVWNERNSVYTKKGVKKAYQEGTGNAAEINLILTSMLSTAGISANPVLVSTGDRIFHLFPTLDGFNYVVTRVKLADGSILYLDATDRYGLPNVLPNRVIQGRARVIAESGKSQDVVLRPEKPSLNRYRVMCQVDEEGSIKGKLNVDHLDYLAHNFRIVNGGNKNEENATKIQKKYEISELKEYTLKGVKEFGKGVSERFDFTSNDQVEVIEDEMFFAPLMFLRDTENMFKADERTYPIDFIFGFSNEYMVNVKIPEGYDVIEFPKSGMFKLPEGMGSFSYQSMFVNGTIQLVVNETINVPMIPAQYYPAIKEFYNMIIEKEGEQVVLKKI